MKRMRTFLIYALAIVGFFILSTFLENFALRAMYSDISGSFDSHYTVGNGEFSIENVNAKACNVDGYINFDLKNTTESTIDQCYLKLDLYNKQNLLADTEYFEIRDIAPGDVKSFSVKFKANNIKRFEASIVKTLPDKTNIIDILGWEVDLTNVFGLGIDLSNVSIFGTSLLDIFNWENAKTTGKTFWSWFIQILKGVPWWGYFGGWLFYVGLL